MISVNVLVDHKKWKKNLNKPQLFFDKIIKRFPKKYSYSNKNVNFSLLALVSRRTPNDESSACPGEKIRI